MKNIVLLSCVAVTLFCLTNPAQAGSFNISGTSNSPQTLSSSGQTGTVTLGGTLNINSSNSVAVTVSANASIFNAGTIEQTDGGRAIRSTGNGDVLTITNTAGGLITSAGVGATNPNDAFQMNKTGSVTIYNYGTISTTLTGTTLTGTLSTGAQGLNMNILSNTGTTTAYTNTVYNFAGGTISTYEADAVRPGAGGIIYNSGTIISTNGSGNTSSSDAIDMQQNNTGVTIINGASQTGGTAGLIEGARHGITGGQQVDSYYTSGNANSNNALYDQPFTLSVTNTAGSTIKGDNGSGVNIDGVDATEQVTINNTGLISGNGVTHDGDGVDVDGIVTITNSGTIVSLSSLNDTSEGITVGGGTINNSGTIEGQVINTSGTNTAVGRGITLAGIDHTEYNGVETNIPIQKIYTTTVVTNSGLIKGDSDSGIAILGITGTTNYSVTITNTAGGIIEGGGADAAIDGSAGVTSGTGTIGVASSNNETVINYGTIKADGSGKAISLGMGNNSVQILGGSASVIGDMSGGTLTGTNTAALTIDPTSSGTFNYGGIISNFTSVDVKSGTVTFSGANTYSGSTSIEGVLDLMGAGTIGNTGTLTISGTGIFNLGGSTVTVGTLANSGTINNGTVNASVIGGLSGSGFTKTGTNTLVITGTNTYTGGTTVSAGKLSVNGSVTGNVNVQSGAELGGSGTVSGTISGSGKVGPGNSPGILTAASTDPTGGLSYNFEMTQMGTATWSNSSASGNDVLHLTAALPFSAPLTSSNNINVYFSQTGLTFDGGFFTEGSSDNLTANISNATYNYFVLDSSGTIAYNGNNYDAFTGSVTGTIIQISGANFATGTVNGFTEQFTVGSVPEPSTYVLFGVGLVGLLIIARRRGSAAPRSR